MSRLPITYFAGVHSFWEVTQNKAVIEPSAVQNLHLIGQRFVRSWKFKNGFRGIHCTRPLSWADVAANMVSSIFFCIKYFSVYISFFPVREIWHREQNVSCYAWSIVLLLNTMYPISMMPHWQYKSTRFNGINGRNCDSRLQRSYIAGRE